jgi:hypothetical protein
MPKKKKFIKSPKKYKKNDKKPKFHKKIYK